MKLIKFKLIALSVIALISIGSIHAGKQYGINSASDLPPGIFKKDVNNLPEHIQTKVINTINQHQLSKIDFDYLRADNLGKLYYEEQVFDSAQQVSTSDASLEVAGLTEAETFSLHSKPDAGSTIYIDVDGGKVSRTIWNDRARVRQFNMRPYDSDGDESSFSQVELNAIAEIWRRIAEDYAPFDVDVTTEKPKKVGTNTGVLMITRKADKNGNNIYNCNCGGVAYFNVWGQKDFKYYSPALVFIEGVGIGPHNITEAGSHEIGHNLALGHDTYYDGTTYRGYYSGHGTGNVSWAPIMGVGYYQNVTQWSKGEYLHANTFADDLSVIATRTGVAEDDHANNELLSATELTINNGIVTATSAITDPFNNVPFNKGIIETSEDIDLFAFNTTGGLINFTITPGWFETFSDQARRGMNLDIEATLYDSNGNIVTFTNSEGVITEAISNPDDDTFATISVDLEAGRYYLAIDGVGRGDVLGDGYSDYGSLGHYFINGTVPQ